MSARPGDRSPRARRGAASPPTLFALLALVTLPALTAAVQGAAPLRPVPKVDVSAMEPAVRQQVDAAQRSLAAAPGLAPAAAAASFGEAGKTYLLYAMLDAAAPCFENAAALAPGDFRWPYYAGVVAQRLGDLERAGDDFRRATALQSPFPAALCRLGEVELLRGDLDAAGKSFAAALAFPPWAPEAHYGLGRVALQRGDARGAAEHLEAVLAAQPGASMAHAPLAAAYGRLGQLDRAKAQAALYGDGQVGFPDQLLHEVEVANAGNLRRIAAATQAFREGRFAEAAAGFREAVAVDPGDVRAWIILGHCEEHLGDAAAAEHSFRRAVELAPDNPRARLSLGTLLAQRGARREAIEQLEAAVRLRPDQADARFNLATALAQEGRLAEALAQCEAILKIAPKDTQALALRDRLRADLAAAPPPH